jgi:S1-C subfamily serine protease
MKNSTTIYQTFIICFLTCFANLAQASEANEQLFRRAAIFLEAKRIPESIQLIESIQPKTTEDNFYFNLIAGQLLYEKGAYEKSLIYLQKANTAVSESYKVQIALARTNFKLGRFTALKLHAETAKKIDPNAGDPDLLLALSDMSLGKTDLSKQRITSIIRSKFNSPRHTVAAAKFMVSAGEIKEANNLLNDFLQKQYEAPEVYEYLADLEYSNGNSALSFNLMKKAAELYDIKSQKFDRDVALSWLEFKQNGAPSAAVITPRPKSDLISDITKENNKFPFPNGVSIYGGSGFVIDAGKKIVTNRHVIEGGKEFAIRTGFGEIIKAKVFFKSEIDDIAILELETSLPAERSIKDTEYSKPTVGTAVVTMGYPLWYILGESSPSLTNGIVSKETGIKENKGTFQLTAKINKGSSGGPVFDMSGNVVGITVGKLDLLRIQEKEGFLPEDVNFAIHVDRMPSEANTKIDPAAKNSTQLTIENLYQKMLGKVVMVATYK